jgi:acyl dehydratase
MRKQLFYDEVQIGQALPSLVKHPTKRQLVKWAGASGEYYEMHYDKDFAQSKGLPGVIVHGMLMGSFLGQMLTDWIGDEGTLKKLNTMNRAMVFPDQDLTCKGIVTKKYLLNGEGIIECDIWLENAKGEKAITGMAVVSLPILPASQK